MRNAFAEAITQLAVIDPTVVLLSGDIGNKLFDKFKAAAPDRFFNCGVAEQSLVGIAAGLALNGFRPVVYTIAPFITYRCLEQIRVDLCYHNLPVTVVGVGAGLSYASLGATHHSCEDIAALRAMPNMRVVCPCDSHEVREIVRQLPELQYPLYMRMGKKGEPAVHTKQSVVPFGKWTQIRDGQDVTILACGTIAHNAVQAATTLGLAGVSAAVWSCSTVKPLDEALLSECFLGGKLVVTIEEHGLIGGFGSAIAEWCIDSRLNGVNLLRLGTSDRFLGECGSQSFAQRQFGIDSDNIASSIKNRLHNED